MNNSEVLQFNDAALRIGIPRSEWESALKKAEPDPAVGIRHAALSGDVNYRVHVARIPRQVGCHFHQHGCETYEVVQGKGVLHFGKVSQSDDGTSIEWNSPVEVFTGDCFLIPEGYAHQLQKHGNEELTILFACPDSHINDEEDRYHLEDSPYL